jgi:mannose-6-phosphate isomerase-like protein (cupin superfamily)
MDQPKRVEKPWGFELWWAHTDLYAGKILRVESGHRLSLQYHRQKDESCYVLSGRVRLIKGPTLDELTETELGPGACWRNRPGEIHTIEGLDASEIVEVSTPHLDDVVRLLDDYGRANTNEVQSADDVVSAVAGPRLLDRDQITARIGIDRAQFTEVVSSPGFPQPAGYFRGRTLWDAHALELWLTRPESADSAVDIGGKSASGA